MGVPLNTDGQGDEAQSGSEAPADSTSFTDLISEAGVAAVTGLPPKAQRSFWKAFGRVFTAGAEWPASFFEGRARITAARSSAEVARIEVNTADMKSQQKSRDVVNRGTAKLAVGYFENSDLAKRAASYHGEHILREQINREEVVLAAAEELKNNPPNDDSKSDIDDDWLFSFLKEASSRSNEDYRAMFGRILAGEIKNPGTFSIGTAQTLARLDKETADIFQKACCLTSEVGMTFRIISEGFASIGDNKLTKLGLSYGQYARLVEYGLIRSEIHENTNIESRYFEDKLCFINHVDGKLAITRTAASNPDGFKGDLQFGGPSLTKIGAELMTVVSLKQSDEYILLLAKWLKQYRVHLYKNIKSSSGGITGDLVVVQD